MNFTMFLALLGKKKKQVARSNESDRRDLIRFITSNLFPTSPLSKKINRLIQQLFPCELLLFRCESEYQSTLQRVVRVDGIPEILGSHGVFLVHFSALVRDLHIAHVSGE